MSACRSSIHRVVAGPPRAAVSAAATLLLVLTVLTPAQVTLPPDFEVVQLPGSFTVPTDLCFAPDGSLFVVEKKGVVRRYTSAGLLDPTPVIDLEDEVNSHQHRGMLSMALHPGWVPDGGPNSWVYLLYTVSPVPGQDLTYAEDDKYSFSRLTRYRAIENLGIVTADVGSRQILIGNQLPDGSVPDGIASIHSSHSNGELVFAQDGSLIFAHGDGAHFDMTDGGGNNDPGFDDWIHPQTGLKGPTPKSQDNGAFRSQNLGSLSGKILRIDPATGFGYPSNPFYDGDVTSNASKVWALGLRNPFRTLIFPGTGAADPALGQPGVILVGDVGNTDFEELSLSRVGGENFGWPCHEGPELEEQYQDYVPGPPPHDLSCSDPVVGTLTGPLFAWHHNDASEMVPAGVHFDAAGNPQPGVFGHCAIGGAHYAGGSYGPEYAGRIFFADWVDNWIKTLEVDGNYDVVAVRDFMGGPTSVGELESHPLVGEIYFTDTNDGTVSKIRNTIGNATPVAVADAFPTIGAAPLAVSFTGSGSFDFDEDPISYLWTFGDGSPSSATPDPRHTYLADGAYLATLMVTDDGGLSSFAEVPIFVGDAPVGVAILSPSPGATFTAPDTLLLDGVAEDLGGGPLSYEWTVDFHHDTHVHPLVFDSTEQTVLFPVDLDHGEGLFYYDIGFEATNGAGLSSSAHVFVYSDSDVHDVTGTMRPIGKLDELVPPVPTSGLGNIDIEVVRDGVTPPPGGTELLQQYASFHDGDQGDDDWLGFELLQPLEEEMRWVAVEFQEGLHGASGGWWESFDVEVRDGGAWAPVDNLSVTPAYPFALSGQPFFDGQGFDTYTLHFDPAHGDAIRLRGEPGGIDGYVSAGELRARLIRVPQPPPSHADLTPAGTIIAKVFSLSPPVPTGLGNKDPQTIRNGTMPEPGSASAWAQYDTRHGGDQGDEDWIGYDFGAWRTLTRLSFQEGLHFFDGGAFDTIDVEVQLADGGPWAPVTGLSITPPYAGLNGTSYESFSLDFDPIAARAIRLVGDPAGQRNYISVGELSVFAPKLDGDCGSYSYGSGLGGANTLTLDTPTPPALGLPLVIEVGGASGPGGGQLALSFGLASLPLNGGTLLVNPDLMILLPIGFDGDGEFVMNASIPNDAVLDGISLWVQAVATGQPQPWDMRFSNGLQINLCAW